jgi:hypothetical protein
LPRTLFSYHDLYCPSVIFGLLLGLFSGRGGSP